MGVFRNDETLEGGGDLGDLEDDMFVGAWQADLNILENADLLGFSCITVSRVYIKWLRVAVLWLGKKKKPIG